MLSFLLTIYYNYKMMLGSKGINPHELAHRWVKDLNTRSNMSIKWDDDPTICEY